MSNDNPMTRLMLAMLRQKSLKDINWDKLAQDPLLENDKKTNGHALRMRFKRFRDQMEGTPPTTRRPRDPNAPRQPKPSNRRRQSREAGQSQPHTSPVKRKRGNSDDIEDNVKREEEERGRRSETIAPEAVMSGGLGLGIVSDGISPDIDLTVDKRVKSESGMRHQGQYHHQHQPTLPQTPSPPPSPSPSSSRLLTAHRHPHGSHHISHTHYPSQYSQPTSHPDSQSMSFGNPDSDGLYNSFGTSLMNESIYANSPMMPDSFDMGMSFESSFGVDGGLTGQWSSQEVVPDTLAPSGAIIDGANGEGSANGSGGGENAGVNEAGDIKREQRWRY